MKFDNSIFTRLTAVVCFFFVAATFVQAASYEVFMVRGDVMYEFSGENLTPGTTIASGERVKFSDTEAVVVLLGDGERYTLSAKNLGTKFKPGEFVTVKKATKRGQSGFKARQITALDDQKKIAAYFNDSPYLLLNETLVKISAAAYPLTDEKYMFLRYKLEGAFMMATKKLKNYKGMIVINPDEILEGGKDPNALGSFELHHFGGVGKMGKVCDVNMKLVDAQAIREEVKRFTEQIKTAFGADSIDESTLKQEVLDYLCEYYGVPDQEAFDEWAQETVN